MSANALSLESVAAALGAETWTTPLTPTSDAKVASASTARSLVTGLISVENANRARSASPNANERLRPLVTTAAMTTETMNSARPERE